MNASEWICIFRFVSSGSQVTHSTPFADVVCTSEKKDYRQAKATVHLDAAFSLHNILQPSVQYI